MGGCVYWGSDVGLWSIMVYGWGGSMLYDWDVWCDVYVCIGYIVEYIMMEVWV